MHHYAYSSHRASSDDFFHDFDQPLRIAASPASHWRRRLTFRFHLVGRFGGEHQDHAFW
jgi:hypothetical protein